MNIPNIIGTRFAVPIQNRQRSNQTQNQNIRMSQPLMHDTVSFGATVKELTSRTEGVSLRVARSVHDLAEPMQKRVHTFMYDTFGDLLVTELNPNNPIWIIKDRRKTANSIMEKSATRQWNCKAEIFDFMTDLNGAKIVVRDNSKKVVEKILSRFIPMIEKGQMELLEIENKRPIITQNFKRDEKEKYDYASTDFLEELQAIQEETWENSRHKEPKLVRVDLNDYTKMNYVAIHFLLKFPGEQRPFELMIMDKNVNALKDLDDKLFKILNNKNVDKKYKPLVDIIKPLKEPGNKDILDKFNQYRKDAFIFQREKEPTTYFPDDTSIDYFLPLKYNIPAKYDLNNLNRIMLECDANAEKKASKK